MTSKLVVNTIESDTGISSVSFASSISMSSTSKFFFSAAGVDIGADTNINRPEAGVLGFNINSSEKVRITSNGHVGIGTDTPNGDLQIRAGQNASFRVLADPSTSGLFVGNYGSGDGYRSLSLLGSNIRLYTITAGALSGAQQRVHITSGGQVNIGTGELTQTARKLNVYGGATRVTQTSGGNTVEVFGHTTSGQSYGLLVNAGSTSGDYCANFRNSSGTTLFRIRGDGKIGIGTDAPAGNLEIDTASSTTMIMLDVSGTNFARIGHNSSSGVAVLDVRSEGHTRFLTNGNNERLRIDSSGRLLLSTTTAGESNSSADDFVIGNSGSGNSGMSIITGTGNNGHIFFGDGDNDTMGGFRYQHSIDALQFYAGGSAPFYLKSNAIGLHENYPIANSLTIRGANTDDTPLLVLKRHTDGTQSDGEIIGKIQFMSNENNVDSGNHQPRAEIHGVTVSTSGAAKMDFYTVPNSTTTPLKRMTINQLGQVTIPNQPAFNAHRNGQSSIQMASNSGLDVVFATEDFDNGNCYNNSNGRFTAPVDGKYFFGIQFYTGFSVTAVRVMHANWTKNGSIHASADLFGGISNAGGTHYHPTVNAQVMMSLSANDYVTFRLGNISTSGSGNTYLYGSTGTRFFGHLVA